MQACLVMGEDCVTLDMQSCLVMAQDHDIAMQILENKYGNNEPFKGWFNRESRLRKCK